MLGLEGAKGSPTAGSKTTGTGQRTALDLLDVDGASLVASAGGTAMYLANDRPDLAFAAKT
eukprot:2392801-Lingulodinium_polyedra.AAC.1